MDRKFGHARFHNTPYLILYCISNIIYDCIHMYEDFLGRGCFFTVPFDGHCVHSFQVYDVCIPPPYNKGHF